MIEVVFTIVLKTFISHISNRSPASLVSGLVFVMGGSPSDVDKVLVT